MARQTADPLDQSTSYGSLYYARCIILRVITAAGQGDGGEEKMEGKERPQHNKLSS